MRTIGMFIFILLEISLSAQTSRHYSNEFLNIGVDAKALSMGNAVVANTMDATAGYWNPALLYKVQNQQIVLMHTSYFANIAQYDYMAYAKPINERTSISISLIRFGVDNIMNTTRLIDGEGNIDYDRITYFSAADYALNLSIGRKDVWKGLDLGLTTKLIYRHIGKFATGYGLGFDVAAAYQVGEWNFGLIARDITTTFNYWSIDQEELESIKQSIPGQNQETPNSVELTLPKLQIGIQHNFPLKTHWELSAEFDIHSRFFKTSSLISTRAISLDPALGLELQYFKMAFLRIGVNNFQRQDFFDEKEITFQPNAGLGFRYKGINLDYALTNIGSANFFSHVFSLKIDLDRFLTSKEK